MGASPSLSFTDSGGSNPRNIHCHDGQPQEGSHRLNDSESQPSELISRFATSEHSFPPLPLPPLLQGSDMHSSHSSPSLYTWLHNGVASFLSKFRGPESRPCKEVKQDDPGMSQLHSSRPSSSPNQCYFSCPTSPVRELEYSGPSPSPISPVEYVSSSLSPERNSSSYSSSSEHDYFSLSLSPERELSSLSPMRELNSFSLPSLLERKHSSSSPSPKLESFSLPPSLKPPNSSPFLLPKLGYFRSPSFPEREYSSHSSSPEHEYLTCPSSPEHKAPSPELASPPLAFDNISQRGSSPWLCSSVVSSLPSNPGNSFSPAVSAVNKTISTPSLLTEEVMAIGEDAIERYELVRIQPYLCLPEAPQIVPFSSFSLEELEIYYAAAIDTKNILQLRKALVKADIGDSLELLASKLSLYTRDNAILTNVLDELKVIRNECCDRQVELDFHALESLRYMLPLHQPSLLETHYTLFSTLGHALELKDDAQQAAHHFMKDPSALMEHRLPRFGISQR